MSRTWAQSCRALRLVTRPEVRRRNFRGSRPSSGSISSRYADRGSCPAGCSEVMRTPTLVRRRARRPPGPNERNQKRLCGSEPGPRRPARMLGANGAEARPYRHARGGIHGRPPFKRTGAGSWLPAHPWDSSTVLEKPARFQPYFLWHSAEVIFLARIRPPRTFGPSGSTYTRRGILVLSGL